MVEEEEGSRRGNGEVAADRSQSVSLVIELEKRDEEMKR